MADRFPGGVISKTPPTVVAPVDGEGGSASGVWTLDEQLGLQKAGSWPQKILPRELYAWGRNLSGELGQNNTISRSSPVQVGFLTDWNQVSAGNNHTLSVKSDGTLWGWGTNGSGQLGDGTVVNKSSPVQIGALTSWSRVSAGNVFSASVTTDGQLYAWGTNGSGQLGDGTVVNKSSPVQVGSLTNWAQVSAGGSHTAAVKTDGTLWAWGSNGSGNLGDGTVVSKSSPVQVGSLTNWSQVAASVGVHTTAVTTTGELYAWGNGSQGQLGQNNTISRSSPVQVGSLTNWSQVAAADAHTASVKTDGTLWTWGRNNNYGQLGLNDTISRSSPVQVGALTNWSQVAATDLHNASVKTDGTLWTWGKNIGGATPQGQLGDGTSINRSSPVQVGALTSWSQATTGFTHTAAISKLG